MMKVKFNKFEKVAGLFVLVAIGGFLASLVGVAIKQGWFESKVSYTTTFLSADGIHPGTAVQIAGLRAGSVDEVDLTHDNRIFVRYSVLAKFQSKIRQDSMAQLIRPFVIGERILELTVGSATSPAKAPDSQVDPKETVDLMSLLSGRDLGNYLESFSSMLDNLKNLAQALLDKDRTKNFITMVDQVGPLLRNLNLMSTEVTKLSRQATKDENLKTVLGQLAVTTKELNSMLPELSQRAPRMAKDLSQLVLNLADLTEQFRVVIPALAEVAPDLPHASRRAVEALDQAVVLIKAMQKSFFIRGSVADVKEEEAKEEAERQPSSKPAEEGNE